MKSGPYSPQLPQDVWGRRRHGSRPPFKEEMETAPLPSNFRVLPADERGYTVTPVLTGLKHISVSTSLRLLFGARLDSMLIGEV
jgi:hypothetical protein